MLSRLATSVLGRRAVKKAQYPSRIPAAITLADFSDDDDDEMDRTEEEHRRKRRRWRKSVKVGFGTMEKFLGRGFWRTKSSVSDEEFQRAQERAVFEGTLDSSVPALRDEKMREIRSLKRSGFAGFGWNDVKS